MTLQQLQHIVIMVDDADNDVANVVGANKKSKI